MTEQYLDGITPWDVYTPRLRARLLESNLGADVPVLFVHGNVASSRFFEETLVALPSPYRGLAPDLRGFDGSEGKPVDATRGLRDFSDDLHDLVKVPRGADRPEDPLSRMVDGRRRSHAVRHRLPPGSHLAYADQPYVALRDGRDERSRRAERGKLCAR